MKPTILHRLIHHPASSQPTTLRYRAAAKAGGIGSPGLVWRSSWALRLRSTGEGPLTSRAKRQGHLRRFRSSWPRQRRATSACTSPDWGRSRRSTRLTVKTRVDGQLMTVAYKEGDNGRRKARRSSRSIRVPFRCSSNRQRRSSLKDQAALQNAQIDLQRYESLITKNAVAQQILQTQRATVAQDEATMKTDQANIDSAKLNIDVLPHHRADHRSHRSPARRSRQHGLGRREHAAARHHADAADQRHLHDSRTAGRRRPGRAQSGQIAAAWTRSIAMARRFSPAAS